MKRWALLLLLLSNGCFPYMQKIQDDAAAFQKAHPEGLKQVTVLGRSLRYTVNGQPGAALLLFIHGSPGDWQGWAGQLNDPDLNRHFRVVAPDRLGYGGSEPGQPEPSLAKQAAVLAELIRIEGQGGPAFVVGHSMGGPIAARLAMDHPELVKGLVLAAPSIDPEQEHVTWYQRVADWRVVRWMLPRDIVTCNREIMPLKPELEAMLPLWKSIRCPVRLIQGLDDDLVPPANADFAERVLSANQLQVTRVAGLNHFIPWKRPDLIVKAIRSF